MRMNTPAVLVLGLREAGDSRLSLVGGKVFNLGKMIAAGLPVPSGFCVTTAAFDLFVASYLSRNNSVVRQFWHCWTVGRG